MKAYLATIGLLIAISAGAGCATAAPDAHQSPAPQSPPIVQSPSVSNGPAPSAPPAQADPARVAGLVDVRTIVPDAVIDLRYATANNFVGVPLYPANARCLVHESMAEGLKTAAAKLRSSGAVLVFWDCYRPHSVQVAMYEKVPNPAWVAKPGPFSRSHETGRSVDVTFATRAPGCPNGLCLADMGTDFDSFTPRATAFATEGLSQAQLANRARLRDAMNTGGLAVYSGEWWHFDGPGAGVQRPIVDVPVN